MYIFAAKYWKTVLNQGLITKEEVRQLQRIDPSPTKKYLDWLVKIWIKEKPDINELRNYIEEFHVLTESHRIMGADINRFPDYESFKNFVNEENERSSATLEELENDYEVIRDDENLLAVVPYTHAASRKLGLKYFGVRSDKTAPWCTTYANENHFNDYFYNRGMAFYYVKVRGEGLKQKLHTLRRDNSLENLAYQIYPEGYQIYPEGNVAIWDANDSQLDTPTANKVRKIIGL